ncbi:unnamed protein product [Prorocentrum cordatum]|uniref:Uncharacterized protein n=1 Tax=Prorocentrum cordatum TaxID=2364126 RepID=A0ABN9ST20_9DINO|nr:unnamed protein product [Polarella glacialis]
MLFVTEFSRSCPPRSCPQQAPARVPASGRSVDSPQAWTFALPACAPDGSRACCTAPRRSSLAHVCRPCEVERVGARPRTGEPLVRLADGRLLLFHAGLQHWTVLAGVHGAAALPRREPDAAPAAAEPGPPAAERGAPLGAACAGDAEDQAQRVGRSVCGCGSPVEHVQASELTIGQESLSLVLHQSVGTQLRPHSIQTDRSGKRGPWASRQWSRKWVFSGKIRKGAEGTEGTELAVIPAIPTNESYKGIDGGEWMLTGRDVAAASFEAHRAFYLMQHGKQLFVGLSPYILHRTLGNIVVITAYLRQGDWNYEPARWGNKHWILRLGGAIAIPKGCRATCGKGKGYVYDRGIARAGVARSIIMEAYHYVPWKTHCGIEITVSICHAWPYSCINIPSALRTIGRPKRVAAHNIKRSKARPRNMKSRKARAQKAKAHSRKSYVVWASGRGSRLLVSYTKGLEALRFAKPYAEVHMLSRKDLLLEMGDGQSKVYDSANRKKLLIVFVGRGSPAALVALEKQGDRAKVAHRGAARGYDADAAKRGVVTEVAGLAPSSTLQIRGQAARVISGKAPGRHLAASLAATVGDEDPATKILRSPQSGPGIGLTVRSATSGPGSAALAARTGSERQRPLPSDWPRQPVQFVREFVGAIQSRARAGAAGPCIYGEFLDRGGSDATATNVEVASLMRRGLRVAAGRQWPGPRLAGAANQVGAACQARETAEQTPVHRVWLFPCNEGHEGNADSGSATPSALAIAEFQPASRLRGVASKARALALLLGDGVVGGDGVARPTARQGTQTSTVRRAEQIEILWIPSQGEDQEFTACLQALTRSLATRDRGRLRQWCAALLGGKVGSSAVSWPWLSGELSLMKLAGRELVQSVVLPTLAGTAGAQELRAEVAGVAGALPSDGAAPAAAVF